MSAGVDVAAENIVRMVGGGGGVFVVGRDHFEQG